MAATPGDSAPSVARHLHPLEAAELAATAWGLPDGWIVQHQPPNGQLAILPRAYAQPYFRCWVSDRELGCTYRPGLTGLRVPRNIRH